MTLLVAAYLPRKPTCEPSNTDVTVSGTVESVESEFRSFYVRNELLLRTNIEKRKMTATTRFLEQQVLFDNEKKKRSLIVFEITRDQTLIDNTFLSYGQWASSRKQRIAALKEETSRRFHQKHKHQQQKKIHQFNKQVDTLFEEWQRLQSYTAVQERKASLLFGHVQYISKQYCKVLRIFSDICNYKEININILRRQKNERRKREDSELSIRTQIEQQQEFQFSISIFCTIHMSGHAIIKQREHDDFQFFLDQQSWSLLRHNRNLEERNINNQYTTYVSSIRSICSQRLLEKESSEQSNRNKLSNEESVFRKKLVGEEAGKWCRSRKREIEIQTTIEDINKALDRLVDMFYRSRVTVVRSEISSRSSIQNNFDIAMMFLMSYLQSKQTTEVAMALHHEETVSNTQILPLVELGKRGQHIHTQGKERRAIYRLFKREKLTLRTAEVLDLINRNKFL